MNRIDLKDLVEKSRDLKMTVTKDIIVKEIVNRAQYGYKSVSYQLSKREEGYMIPTVNRAHTFTDMEIHEIINMVKENFYEIVSEIDTIDNSKMFRIDFEW